MLVTDLINVRYLSGFTGSNAALLVFADERMTPFWPPTGATAPRPPSRRPTWKSPSSGPAGGYLAGRAACRRRGGLGFESHVVTVDGYDALAAALGEAGGTTELVRASQTVEALREIKDAGEVALLRLACEAADAALADLVDRGGLRPGRTEREVGRELEALMLDHGADGVSFETIVASGANSAIPHHRPTEAVLAAGDFVKIDFGALVGGYHSDMTRTFVLGKARRLAAGDLPAGRRRAASRPGGAASRGRPARRGRRGAPGDRRRRATASTSATVWATASACRSTKRRESAPPPPVHYLRAPW